MDQQGQPPTSYLGVLGGWVVNVPWSQLQPSPGGPIAADNKIDQAITAVEAVNASDHLDLGLRIRTGAASGAPQWLKTEGGTPITVHNPQGGQTGKIGRFWTASYGAAYAQFESELAAKYDSVPVVREIDISRCSLLFDEDLIRFETDPATVANLLAAGYTETADQACQQDQVQQMEVWHHTRLDYSFNPYQVITPTGHSTDVGFTDQMMTYCRTTLGQQCVLFNESIRSPITALAAPYQTMYAAMKQLGPPLAFQTATASKVGNLAATLAWAQQEGADCVEVHAAPGGTTPQVAATSLKGWNARLAVNART